MKNITQTDAEKAAPYFQHPQQQQNTPAYDQIAAQTPNTAALQAQIQDLTTRLEILENKRINFNTDLIGLFETVTAAPTIIPVSPYDQFKLANISGTFYIYAYNTNSKTWKRVVIS